MKMLTIMACFLGFICTVIGANIFILTNIFWGIILFLCAYVFAGEWYIKSLNDDMCDIEMWKEI